MMQAIRIILLLVFLNCCASYSLICQQIDSIDNHQFSVGELREDFRVLRNRYQTQLANIYLYNTKQNLDSIFDLMYQQIVPMNEQTFYHYISPLMSIVKDGHSLILPSKASVEFHTNNSTYFPFKVYWHENHLYVEMNLSDNKSIIDGMEILSINDELVSDVCEKIMHRLVRDGFNESYPRWILNNYFRGFYGMTYGYPSEYKLLVKTKEDVISTILVKSVSLRAIQENRKLRYLNSLITDSKQKAIVFEMKAEIGILTIKSWDTKLLRTLYHQNFRKEISLIFDSIEVNAIKHLVIDLRDNQGGSSVYGDYLLQYLFDHSFNYTTGLFKVKGMTDSGQVLDRLNASFTHTHFPKENNYKGELIVLINGGSFSNSGIFCSRLEADGRAIFIGEETGGNKSVLTGVYGIGGKTILPNTKIICDRSNYRMIVTNLKENSGHGVKPNYLITPSIKDLLQKKDVVMLKALELIDQHSD